LKLLKRQSFKLFICGSWQSLKLLICDMKELAALQAAHYLNYAASDAT